MKPKIVVVGSSNTDLVVQVPHFPSPGETVLGDGFIMAHGGKGANQAVAAARLGAQITFVSSLGQDEFGELAMKAYRAEGINTEFIQIDNKAPSGVALILVDPKGENEIAVASGANFTLTAADVEIAEPAIQSADCVLLQLETPLPTVEAAVALARKHEVPVILNPAPARPLPESILQSIDVLTPNETEAEMLGLVGSDQTDIAANMLRLGIETVVMTMGSRGALLVRDGEQQQIPAFPTSAVDTTAAGDAFNGALAVAIASGRPLKDAVRFANAAGAFAASSPGAQSSLPTLDDVNGLVG
jgi:ribokinase